MFTGLVSATGIVRAVAGRFDGATITAASAILSNIKIGESIAIDGVCLTVVKKEEGRAVFDVVRHTLSTTTLKNKRCGDKVNIEMALKAGDSIGGHFVTGHVDCVGKIEKAVKRPSEMELELSFPPGPAVPIVAKGSIAIDGVSLTIARIEGGRIRVYVIPHTMTATTLGSKSAGDEVNIEFDMLMKRQPNPVQPSGRARVITEDFLREKGLI